MNTFLVTVLVIGAISMVVMKREVFPNFKLEILLVSVPFPGATAAEVEDGICQKIESAVSGAEGLKKITSVAKESFGYCILELNSNITDVQPVLNDIRSRIDQIASFLPPRAEDPEVRQIVFRKPAISVGILGPEKTKATKLQADLAIRELAEEIRSELLALRPVKPTKEEMVSSPRAIFAPLYQPKGAAITSAEIAAERPFEVSIEVSEDTLRQYGLSLRSFAQIVRQQNIDVPGGKMETPGQEMLLRGNNKRETGTEIAKLPVLTKPNGDVLTVGDLGNVIDGFAETVSVNLIDGRPGLVVEVSKTDTEDLFTVVEAVKKYAAEKKLPAGYELRLWNDDSIDVQDRIDLLTTNGIQGLILVFVVLAVFLDIRLAFWVAMGIPVSILGAGFVLLVLGQSLNMLSMFAFLMALGIVVDDAIVIGENIYLKREQGMGFVDAAVAGTIEVVPSVFASVSTTIIAFLPLMFVTGVMGKFIAVMPVAVIAMLIISLFESTFILPSHLAHENNLFMRTLSVVFYVFKPLLWIFTWINRGATVLLDSFIERVYQPVLYWSLHHKPVVVSLMIASLCLTIGLVAAGIAPLAFFPKLDGREISAVIAFPNGTSAEFASSAAKKLKEAIIKIDEEVQQSGEPSVIETVYEKIGEVGNTLQGPTGVTSGSHVGSVAVLLTPAANRSITSQELLKRWRAAVPKISGTEALKFDSPSMGPGGGAIEFKILANDDSLEHLDQITEECKAYLATQMGVFDIEDDSRPGKWEMKLRLNEQGQALGLDEASLAETIRAIYFGEEVMRLQRGRHEVKLMVRYPRDARSDMESFENIRIRDNQGIERPLMEVAEITHSRQLAEINRLNQKRSITVTADVDREEANATDIIAEMQKNFLPKLLEQYKNNYGAALTVDWEGEQAQTVESLISLFVGFGIALMAMFVLLTLEFRSYSQPLIIMSIIPFGWIGAILGHAIMQLDLTLFSFFGLIALTGVIVNDSIVLVDFINHRVRDGIPLFDALMSAGKRRFRPILLTSMTTVAGLFPILMETSMQAQVLIPMAVSLIFGLMTGTFLILILVPVFYQIYGLSLRLFGIPLFHDDDEHDGGDQAGSGMSYNGPSNGAAKTIIKEKEVEREPVLS